MTSNDQTWAADAACAKTPPDDLFVKGAAQRQAREICFGCSVRMECLADALDSRMPYGVWGGLTERERRVLIRRYPRVTSWEEVLRRDDDAVIAELRAQHAPRLLTARSRD